jgi:predicted nucleic acid-binding protein
MIVDANLLLYAVDENSTHNVAAGTWLQETLDGDSRVGLPWQTSARSSGSSHIRESPQTRCPPPTRGDT